MIIDVHIHILSKQEIALGAEQSARRVGDRKEEEARPRAVSGYWARTLTDLSDRGRMNHNPRSEKGSWPPEKSGAAKHPAMFRVMDAFS